MNDDFIKDEAKTIKSLNELITLCGYPKELANEIDKIIFDWLLLFFLNTGECGDTRHAEKISTLREIRDFFSSIEVKNTSESQKKEE